MPMPALWGPSPRLWNLKLRECSFAALVPTDCWSPGLSTRYHCSIPTTFSFVIPTPNCGHQHCGHQHQAMDTNTKLWTPTPTPCCGQGLSRQQQQGSDCYNVASASAIGQHYGQDMNQCNENLLFDQSDQSDNMLICQLLLVLFLAQRWIFRSLISMQSSSLHSHIKSQQSSAQ